jgi:hypothetical protein
MAYFCEIRTAESALLKRDGGFATEDAAKIAGREDARKMKSSCQSVPQTISRALLRTRRCITRITNFNKKQILASG